LIHVNLLNWNPLNSTAPNPHYVRVETESDHAS